MTGFFIRLFLISLHHELLTLNFKKMKKKFNLIFTLLLFAFIFSFASVDDDVGEKETVKMEEVLKSYEVKKAEGWKLTKLTFEQHKIYSPYAIAIFQKGDCEMVCYSKTISDFEIRKEINPVTKTKNPLKEHLSLFYIKKHIVKKNRISSSGGLPSRTT